jgi:hypothetical protein
MGAALLGLRRRLRKVSIAASIRTRQRAKPHG